jgi:superfamily II DNA or RNA helicase
MNILVKTPTKAYLEGTPEEIESLAKFLSYTNTGAQFQYKKHMKNRWWRQKDPDGWQARAQELKADLNRCLLFKADGKPCLRPGSIPYIQEEFQNVHVTYDPTYVKSFAKPKPFPWYKKLPFELHPYQKESVAELPEIKHGNVQLCTGAGKSAIILTIARNLGLKTVVAVPSQSIFSEMLPKFEEVFGKSSVGALGDGKKRLGKLFTVAISKSLTNLKPGTKEYNEIASAQLLLVDESHLWGASTLDEVCHNLFADVPYRMFFSGTQTRGDGTEKLLQSIIGKTVVTLTTEEAIKGGYICNHEFRIVPILTTRPGFNSDDALEMKRNHFLRNDNIAKFIANLANSVAQAKGEQTLVLVDEIDQIRRILPLLQVPYACATGSKEPDLGDTDPSNAVLRFNKGEAKILLGTSCIATGTNIFPTHHTVNWSGGTSEVKTKQGAVGRSVRILKGSGFEKYHVPKEKALIWDFDVQNVDIMKRHLIERIGYYRDSGTEIKAIG